MYHSENEEFILQSASIRAAPSCPYCPSGLFFQESFSSGLNLNFDPVHDFPFVLNSCMMCNYISGKIFQLLNMGICQRSSVLEKAIIFLLEFFSLKFRVRATLLIVPNILRDVGIMFAGINSECGKFTTEALQADSCMGIIKNYALIVI